MYNRKVGIEYIEYKNYKLQNIHDISHIYNNLITKKEKSNDFKIVGKLLKLKEIKKNLLFLVLEAQI